ncbi:plasma membrane ATPase 2 [[Candida] jaroonii]|uniref:Plasma membrane ATPase 2 n=1 Tax=[Candida] jaroonii TaxID=467808 RepID=A0ACA9Y2B0_9ASCO|nr:plasma membrane ATPase 2 [[Candida] jaroonii]
MSKFDTEDSIKYDTESEIGTVNDMVRFKAQTKDRNIDSKLSRSNSMFTITSRAEDVLPTAFKTISQTIDSNVSNGAAEAEDVMGTNKFLNITWHSDDITKVADDLEADLVNGLNDQQISSKIKEFGLNVKSKPPGDLFWRIFFYFFGGFGSLLLVAGILSIICWKPLGDPPQIANLALGLILLAVFIIQAVLNFIQDFSSGQVMKSINNMIPLEVKVIRSSEVVDLRSEDLVPGDLILIEPFTKIAADIRIFESKGLVFDRSILTGETIPCPGKVISSSLNYLESESIAMQGTFCVGGHGKGVVVSTGNFTIFGEIAKLSSAPKKKLTTLQIELFRFIAIVSIVIVLVMVLVIILWATWIRHTYPEWINVPTLIIDLVSVVVSFIPEGLPISLTVCLIVVAHRMKESQILVKSLNIVETLGSVSVLCSDKTGTLTTGKMTVTNSFGDQERLSLIGTLCNETEVIDNERGGGNQTDAAIFQYFSQFNDYNTILNRYTLVKHLNFSSKLKYMVKIFKDEIEDKFILTVKGAPDVLLQKAKFFNAIDGLKSIPDVGIGSFTSKQLEWSNNGERVILLGSKILDKVNMDDDFFDIEDFTIDGLISLSDPLRSKIPEVIGQLQDAGIKLVMITGDFELTAKSIAKKCGIIKHDQIDNINTLTDNSQDRSVVINGPDMYRLSEIDWDKLASYNEIVFSRTTPEQKLKIVKEFQKRKHVVGMTGDGVNDSPSIKQADVGISMADGSEIAKEASDLVLLDSFTSIVEALIYGRLVFENVKKTICYLLPAGCFSELWAVLLNVLGGYPQMLSSFCMIIISCLTDCVASMIISLERPEKNLLYKKPRCVSGERLVDWRLLLHSYLFVGTFECFVAMLLSFLHFTRNGIPFSALKSYGDYEDPVRISSLLASSCSIYFVSLVILQAFNLMVVRSRYVSLFKNLNWRLLVVLPVFASTFIWTNIPAVQKAISSSSVPVEYYFIAVGFGVLLVAYDETRKLIIRNIPHSFVAKAAW